MNKPLRLIKKNIQTIIEIPEDCRITDGEKITIRGVQLMPNGMVIRNCAQGNETVLTVKVKK